MKSSRSPKIDRKISASSASTSSSSALSPSMHEEDLRVNTKLAGGDDHGTTTRLHRTQSATSASISSRHRGDVVVVASRGNPSRSSLPTVNPISLNRRRNSRDSDTSFLSIPPPPISDIKDRSSSSSGANNFPSSRGSDEGVLHVVKEDQEMHPGQLGGGNSTNLSSRMSNWFTNMLPNTSQSWSNVPSGPGNSNRSDTSRSPFISSTGSSIPSQSSSSSPGRKLPQVATNLLAAAKQKATGGMRYLIDSEAQPDGCEDPIWVMGVAHAYTDIQDEDVSLRRNPSPVMSADKRLPVSSLTSQQQQPGDRITHLFSSSAASGSGSGNAFSPRKVRGDRSMESTNGSPSRPGKGKGREKSKESVLGRRWPDGCELRDGSFAMPPSSVVF